MRILLTTLSFSFHGPCIQAVQNTYLYGVNDTAIFNCIWRVKPAFFLCACKQKKRPDYYAQHELNNSHWSNRGVFAQCCNGSGISTQLPCCLLFLVAFLNTDDILEGINRILVPTRENRRKILVPVRHKISDVNNGPTIPNSSGHFCQSNLQHTMEY